MVENLLLTVGNSMMGDDGAGPLLAEMMQAQPIPGWVVIDGGSSPENVLHQIEALKPQHVLIVDAAEMALEPGEVRFVDDQAIADMFIMSTHNLPLSFVIERLRESVPDVLFLGIQPGLVAFYCPMSPSVRQAVEKLHQNLASDPELMAYAWL